MDSGLLNRIINCTDLPRLPTVVTKLIEVIDSPNANADMVADVVAKDPDMALKLLRAVNSSYYGLSSTISSVKQAVAMLGMKEVRHITIGCALSSTMDHTSKSIADATVFWRHALFCAAACKLLAEQLRELHSEESFLNGLLVNVGSLAMVSLLGSNHVPKKWATMTELARLEYKKYEGDHAEVSAAIAESWQLPPVLVEPMRYAYRPGQAPEEYRQLARILAAASDAADLIMIAQAGQVEYFFDASNEFCDKVSESLGLKWQAVDQLLDDIGQHASNLTELFTIDTGEIPDFEHFGDDFHLEIKSNPAA